MSLLDRSLVAEPVLPRETATVAALGGDVVVRGLLLSEQMALAVRVQQASHPTDGNDAQENGVRARSRRIAEALADAVVLADDKPLWNAGQWDTFGARHPEEALALYKVACRLNGEDAEATEKN